MSQQQDLPPPGGSGPDTPAHGGSRPEPPPAGAPPPSHDPAPQPGPAPPGHGQPPPPGYGQPPPGYGQPPPGYAPPGYGQPPSPWPGVDALRPEEERLWSTLTHLSFFVFGLIVPLILMLTLGTRSPYVRHHAVEALNFHITVWI